jgi:hypothetical protein
MASLSGRRRPLHYRKQHIVSHRRFNRALFVSVLIVAQVGCSSAPLETDEVGAAPSGTWADEMKREFEKATSPVIKAALEDGKVSDQEFAEMKERYSKCMSAAGITLTRYGFDGGSYTPAPSMSHDEAHKAESRCSDESGEWPIAMFYVQMRVNPSYKDMVPAIVQCFKRNDLVGSGYGVKDYLAGDLPRDDAKAAAIDSCNLDPDGLLGG